MKISDERLADLQHQYAGVYGIHGEVVNLCGEVLELRAEVTKLRSRAERAEALLRDAQTEIDGEDDWIEWVAKVGDHLREEK